MDKFGLIGTNLKESLIYKVYKRLLNKTNVEIEYHYYEMKPNSNDALLHLYLGGVLAYTGYKGIIITHPFMKKAFQALKGNKAYRKLTCIGSCDVPEAVNNVNVLRRVYNSGDDIYWEATNTDGLGFYNTIKDNYNFRNALIIGSGSVAKSIAHTLKENNIEVALLSRNPEKPGKIKIAEKLGVSFAEGINPYDIIINCSPKNVKDFTFLETYVENIGDSYLYDVNYDLVDTNFIKFAKSLHKQPCKYYQDGLAMLIEQAALNWVYWGYDKPNTAVVYQELNAMRH